MLSWEGQEINMDEIGCACDITKILNGQNSLFCTFNCNTEEYDECICVNIIPIPNGASFCVQDLNVRKNELIPHHSASNNREIQNYLHNSAQEEFIRCISLLPSDSKALKLSCSLANGTDDGIFDAWSSTDQSSEKSVDRGGSGNGNYDDEEYSVDSHSQGSGDSSHDDKNSFEASLSNLTLSLATESRF